MDSEAKISMALEAFDNARPEASLFNIMSA
jgi:hypothetical protein